jgi:hypothetical protein
MNQWDLSPQASREEQKPRSGGSKLVLEADGPVAISIWGSVHIPISKEN